MRNLPKRFPWQPRSDGHSADSAAAQRQVPDGRQRGVSAQSLCAGRDLCQIKRWSCGAAFTECGRRQVLRRVVCPFVQVFKCVCVCVCVYVCVCVCVCVLKDGVTCCEPVFQVFIVFGRTFCWAFVLVFYLVQCCGIREGKPGNLDPCGTRPFVLLEKGTVLSKLGCIPRVLVTYFAGRVQRHSGRSATVHSQTAGPTVIAHSQPGHQGTEGQAVLLGTRRAWPFSCRTRHMLPFRPVHVASVTR